jgi:CRP-like cAMP-binding protein
MSGAWVGQVRIPARRGEAPPTQRTGNLLLDALPPEDRRRLLALAGTIALESRQELSRQWGPHSRVLFPCSGICSVVIRLGDGRSVETGTVGREGMVGIHDFLGLDVSPYGVVVQVPGKVVHMSQAAFAEVVAASSAIDRIVRRYIAYVVRSGCQNIACSAVHDVRQRACRWLLMTHDRVVGDEFLLTQDSLAEMLGVHRPTVTKVAGFLRREGVIDYRRGVVRILDRQGLEQGSCECFRVDKQLYERLLRT